MATQCYCLYAQSVRIVCYEIILCAKIRIVCESKKDKRTEVASGQRLIWRAVAAHDDREVSVTVFFLWIIRSDLSKENEA